ncbi:MAG TPA: hypothetical protein VF462_08865 [Micromonosporaceae bacterium]
MESVLFAVLLAPPLIAAAVLAALTAEGKRWLRHWWRRVSRIGAGRRRVGSLQRAAVTGGRQARVRQGAPSDLRRYAAEVSVAAERSMISAQRSRTHWLAAVDEAEAAWTVFESADAEVRRLAAAAALPEPRTPRTPAEYADRERYLHNAVMAAATRGELPVLQLSDALANRNGWDPRRHPVEQELILSRARRDAALAAYRAAADRERTAWRDCEVAAVAAQSLRNEAHAARQAAPRASWSEPDPAVMPAAAKKASLRTAHAG